MDVVAGVLKLYTDASIMGDFISFDRHGNRVRSRVGPAMGAWIGWHDCEASARPTIAGQAFLGEQGTQRAEYLAAIHALAAVLAYARLNKAPSELLLHLDNTTVVKTLVSEWGANVLARHRDVANRLGTEMLELGIAPRVRQVSEGHPEHKQAHRMSKNAWNQVFSDASWRPATGSSGAASSTPL